LMPSPYSSRGNLEDATQLGELLGIRTLTLPIVGSEIKSLKATRI
jgi:hypothetical protein